METKSTKHTARQSSSALALKESFLDVPVHSSQPRRCPEDDKQSTSLHKRATKNSLRKGHGSKDARDFPFNNGFLN